MPLLKSLLEISFENTLLKMLCRKTLWKIYSSKISKKTLKSSLLVGSSSLTMLILFSLNSDKVCIVW